jgi:divalent metal cation (Fe/Co/Zn/Cd) transporter
LKGFTLSENQSNCCPSEQSDVKPETETCQRSTSESHRKTAAVALWLVIATLAYNCLEAVISLWLGHEADSILLVGFGLDSLIECSASIAVLYRLYLEARGVSDEILKMTEDLVHRYVGLTFLLLALFVVAQSGWILWNQKVPQESFYGIILAVASLIIMPIIAWFKFKAARKIGSKSLEAEAKETLVCAVLSLTLLLGLVANATAGWWWADPVAALLMVPWLIREGFAAIRGEGCCA